jgi:hypothetical protein
MNNKEPIAVWTGRELVDLKEEKNSLTVILRTIGCYWQKCLMCGFRNNCSDVPVTHDELMSQFNAAMCKCPEDAIVKIYTSGSFFDDKEVLPETRKEMMARLADDARVQKVVIETLPEFVSAERLDEAKALKKLELAIGLETSSDVIRKKLNKSFTWDDFVRACKTARERGVTIKAYLLLKPPFISEKIAIEDAVSSGKDALQYADTVSINLCNIQRGTPVERLWRREKYRPPWLWSAVEVLKRIKEENAHRIVISDPIAAGSVRGPHNCGKCDLALAGAIRRFSLSQKAGDLDMDCECKETWKMILDTEDFSFGAALVV